MALPTLEQFAPKTYAYSLPALSGNQKDCLNILIGDAAFDESIQERLIHMQDETLREQYHLSLSTWNYVLSVQATTVDELCVALHQLETIAVSH